MAYPILTREMASHFFQKDRIAGLECMLQHLDVTALALEDLSRKGAIIPTIEDRIEAHPVMRSFFKVKCGNTIKENTSLNYLFHLSNCLQVGSNLPTRSAIKPGFRFL